MTHEPNRIIKWSQQETITVMDFSDFLLTLHPTTDSVKMSFGIRGDVIDKRAPNAGRHLSITWENNEMTCVAIYPQPETGNRKPGR